MKRKMFVLLSLLVVAILVLAACNFPVPATPTPAPRPTVLPQDQPAKLEEYQGRLTVTFVADLDSAAAGDQSGVRVVPFYYLKDPTSISQTILVVSTARGPVYLHPNEVGSYVGFTLDDFAAVKVRILGGPVCPWAPTEQYTLFECPPPAP